MARTERYPKSRVARMLINPYAPGDIQDAYPWLRDLSEGYVPATNWNNFWRYVALMYDNDSPYIKEFPATSKRKPEVLRDMDVTIERERELRPFAIAYLKVVDDELWMEICATEMLFWQTTEKMAMGINGDDKDAERQGKLSDLANKTRLRLRDLRKEFFGTDDDLKVREKRAPTAEEIARIRPPKAEERTITE